MYERYQWFKDHVVDVYDWPKKGIVFKDITPLLRDHYHLVIRALWGIAWKYDSPDVIVGIESRGFILGAGLAHSLNVGFVPLRKPGKLPPPVDQISYALEYGEDSLEIKPDFARKRCIIVDDVLATGGTLKAAQALVSRYYDIVNTIVLIDLTFLHGDDIKCDSLLKY
jgi:adenine phosphoribosyltransferase